MVVVAALAGALAVTPGARPAAELKFFIGIRMPESAPIAMWYAEHRHFSRLLDLLEQQVLAFHADDGLNYELMLDIVSYLRYYPDRFHHPQEDVAFTRLVERDPAMKPLVDKLLQEHRVIAAAGSELLKYLEQAVDDVVVERAKVEAAAATYLVYYRRHLALEDRDLVTRAEQLLTRADWDAVMAVVPSGTDPLFGEDSEPRYRQLRRQIALAAK